MYGFTSGVGFIIYLNKIILTYRILRRAKRLGVKNVAPLLEQLVEMISKSIFWLTFVGLGSATILITVRFLGAGLNNYSALILILVVGLFVMLRFFLVFVVFYIDLDMLPAEVTDPGQIAPPHGKTNERGLN